MDIFELPDILIRRWLYVLMPVVIFAGLAVAYVVTVKPSIPVTTEILIDPQGLSTEPAKLTPDLSAPNQDQAIIESQIYVLQSGEILNEVVDKLDLTADPGFFKGPVKDKGLAKATVVGALQRKLTIERAGQSFVVEITFKHSDAVRGAEIANAIATIYLKKVHEARNDASNRASGAFEVQAQALATRVRNAEVELEKFKAAHNLVSTGPQGLVIDQQVEGVNKQLIAARADLGTKQANYNQARTLTVGTVEAGAMPEALASTVLGTMRARYADLASKTNELASALGPSHPQMQAARSQVAGMRDVIEQELARIRQSLKGALERSQANVDMLQARLDTLTKSSLDVSESGIKARELQSEVDTLRLLYKAFLSRSEELGQRQAININNSRIISKAIAIGSSSSLANLMIVIAACLFGIAFGSGLAILREKIGRVFARLAGNVQSNVEREGESEVAREPQPVMAPAVAGETRIGIDGAAERLMHLSGRHRMRTIILLSPDNDNARDDVLSRLAKALYRRRKSVLYSAGERLVPSSRAEAAAPLGDVLKFERLAHGEPTRNPHAAAPTFRNFAGRDGRTDFVLIDTRGKEAQRYLDDLLEGAEGIFVVASDRDGSPRINAFVSSLGPLKDRLLGTIQTGNAA